MRTFQGFRLWYRTEVCTSLPASLTVVPLSVCDVQCEGALQHTAYKGKPGFLDIVRNKLSGKEVHVTVSSTLLFCRRLIFIYLQVESVLAYTLC